MNKTIFEKTVFIIISKCFVYELVHNEILFEVYVHWEGKWLFKVTFLKSNVSIIVLCFHVLVGAIEVSIATMSKLDRSNAAETYTVGFVPSYLLPDKRPNSLNPFLHPLVADLEEAFIEGA